MKYVGHLQGCRCDANVVALAQGLGIQPAGFSTLGRAGRLLNTGL